MKKALLIANNGPEVSFGGGQRTLLSIKLLEAKGYVVDMTLLINRDWGFYGEDSHYIQKWQKNFRLIKYFQPSFRNPYLPDLSIVLFLRSISNDYEIILFRDEITAFKAGFYFLKKGKLIVDINDFLLPQIEGYRKLKYLPLHWFLKSKIKYAWVLSSEHKKYFSSIGYCVPNLPLQAFYENKILNFEKKRTTVPSIIFVGSYLSGLNDFFKKGLEMLIRQVPNVKIFIVSRAITSQMKIEFPIANIEWLNEVEDVADYYSRAWISIVPGYKIDGPLIKVIEAIYFYTPVVCTHTSLNGYEIFNRDENLIPADNSIDVYVENIVTMLSKPGNLDLRALKLKKIANQYFSLESIAKKIPGNTRLPSQE